MLVTSEGVVKLTDFGIAKLLENDDKTQSMKGTPNWSQPLIG